MNGSFAGTTPIFAVCRLLAFGLFPFVLTGCFGAAEPKPKTIAQLAEEVRKSIVLITYKEAISDYDKAIQLKNNYANAYYNQGLALNKMGTK